ncbi:tetratricopeptide repeat protein [Treponema sp.]|uniref:tetratricopeptide repeat protein n=1 Tax=Treponema sp. TaxID=166 RepID=UPI003F0927E1
MKSSVKTTLAELLAAVVLVVAVAVILTVGFSSCATTDSGAQTETVKTETKKKSEYSKTDFMEELQSALNKDGAEAALALYETKLPAKYADDFDLLFLKAAINVSAKNLDEAQALCTQLSARDPQNEDVASLAVAIAKMRGDKAERTKQINLLLEKDKMNSAANIELGEDMFFKKNYKQAKIYYKRALVREPENIDALRGAGQCDYYLENDEEAEKTFKKILEIDPQNTQAFLYLGKIAYAANEYKIASDYAKKALDNEPENYECNMDYGMYERYLGHYNSAEKAWTKAIEIEPDYFLAYAYRAGLYDEQDIFEKAIADYKKVVELNPDYYYAYESIGVLALHEENWTTAREAFMKCYERNKNNISYPLMITYCYYKEGNGTEAKNFSNQVLRKMDRNSIEYSMLRVFHDRAGERPLPQRISAMTNRNLQGKMYYYLALFYDMFGGAEFANEYYAKVVSMNSPMFFEFRLAEWRTKGKVPLK